MEYIDFSKNRNSFVDYADVESVLISGNPQAVEDAKLTICIPTYKRPALLKEALDSALNQETTIPYRIIVLDNEEDFGMTETAKLMREYDNTKICYYKNKKNIGMIGNWNRCAELAETEYFAYLHDDDLLKDKFIKEVSDIVIKRKHIDALVFGFESIGLPFGMKIRPSKLKSIIKKIINVLRSPMSNKLISIPRTANIFLGNAYGPPTCGLLFNKTMFIASGGFNIEYFPSADWVFLIYFSSNYKVLKCKKVLASYRWHSNESLNKNTLDRFKEDRIIILKSIEKQFFLPSILIKIFAKDIKRMYYSGFDMIVPYTIFFKLIRRIYHLKINTLTEVITSKP